MGISAPTCSDSPIMLTILLPEPLLAKINHIVDIGNIAWILQYHAISPILSISANIDTPTISQLPKL